MATVVADPLDVPTVRHPEALAAPPADGIANTRRVDVAVNLAAAADLRKSDPAAAERYEAAMAAMPHVGEQFLDFKLVSELGRGAFGRVFLARQQALAERLVALKITAALHGEAKHLARLQHTNIVPIYSEHRRGDLFAVCMPYFGSATLADLCKSFGSQPSLPTSGRQIVSTLVNRHSTAEGHGDPSHSALSSPTLPGNPHPPTPPGQPPAAHGPSAALLKLEKMSYVEAILWMALRLADGLAHAHERGIVHRDLKPANILLCDDGQPMFLDFNMAEDLNSPAALAVAAMGGTLPYMPPEQLRAYRDRKGIVDARGDVYSLGLVLFHLLTGQHAFPIRRGRSRDILPQILEDRNVPPPSLRRLNRAISPAVEAIIQHCLEPDPANRYADASGLADDLERQRANLPLMHLREPSFGERVSKWARRNPRLASPTSLTFIVAAILLLAVAGSVRLSLRNKEREVEARREHALNRYHEFQDQYRTTQGLLTSEDPTQLTRGLKQAEISLADYRVLEQADWTSLPLVAELSPADRASLRGEVGEMTFLMAHAVYATPHETAEKAIKLNEVAGRNLDDGALPALVRQQAAIQRRELDPEERARLRQMLDNVAGQNARGRFLLACDHAVRGEYREALRIIDGVVTEDPNDFGAWSLKGRCHQALDQDAEALAAYGTAIALRPTYARSYVARAGILVTQQTRARQALQDLDQAVRHQPNLLEARIDRALVLFSLGKYKESIVDLDAALTHQDVPSRVWFIRARARQALGDAPGATRDHLKGLETPPGDAYSWVSRGFAKLSDDPQGALADFIKGEECNPRCIEALNNQAYVYAVKMKQPAEAIPVLDRLLSRFPDNMRALAYRAILKARAGKPDEAIAEARAVAKLNPPPEHLYRAACALALASEGKAEIRAECLRLLASSLSRGWGHDLIATDKDLDPIRDMLEFKQIAGLTKLMRVWTNR